MIDPVDTLARTMWGEARSCGAPGMRHVASVILNRAAHPAWWGRSVVSVCLQPWQFSCRNGNDPNRAKLLAVTAADPDFVLALKIAQQAVNGELLDQTDGADSYYALSMHTPPAWAASAIHTMSDGWHSFFRTVSIAPDIRNVSVLSTDDLNAAELNRVKS